MGAAPEKCPYCRRPKEPHHIETCPAAEEFFGGPKKRKYRTVPRGMCYLCGKCPRGSSGRCVACNRKYQKEIYWRNKERSKPSSRPPLAPRA